METESEKRCSFVRELEAGDGAVLPPICLPRGGLLGVVSKMASLLARRKIF
jgi:hypothetical protein